MENCMNHIGPGHAGDNTNAIFSNTVLEVSANPTVCQLLTKLFTMPTEFVGVENAIIVSVVMLDFHIDVSSLAFKQ